MSNAKTKFVYVTYILSTPEKVFAAITQPEIARQYWEHEAVSDWKPGSRWELVARGAAQEAKVAGVVVENDPPKRLVMTWASPADFDVREKHSRATFDLVPFDKMVQLTITHDELDPDSAAARGISTSWPIVLSSMKSFLESGRPLDVYARPK